MFILVINAGSSSIKYQLFNMPYERAVCSGLVERIGLDNASITHNVYENGQLKSVKVECQLKDHEAGMQKVAKLLTQPDTGVIQNPADIKMVGHRVVHGGESFSDPIIVSSEVKKEIKNLIALAPLHNPGNLTGIEVAEKLFRSAVQVAVFDTAFHQTLPEKAFRFAIPNILYTEKKIRVYGFHGTSHKYVSEKAIEILQIPDSKIISIHLGNGCSMAAIRNGKCIDTSMGFTPLDGLVMGTRSGNIDPSVLLYLMSELGYSSKNLDRLLNKESGMLGLTDFSDMREIKKAFEGGNQNAKIAYDMYAYRIQKYIGAYAAAMNGLDVVIFTAGVGENDALTRELVCRNMEYFGIELDKIKNVDQDMGLREINAADSRTKILIIPTNEEFEIAKQSYALLRQ